MFYQTLIIALLYGCLQVLSPLLKLKTYIKEHLGSCLTITLVPTKEYWKNLVNFPWMLKENINCALRYKILNNLNPSFMTETLEPRLSSRPAREQYKLNLNISRKKQVTFWTKSLESLGPKICNNLPYHIKSAENLNVFKNLIKKWNGSSCSCNVCAL